MEEDGISISKGVFVYKNGLKPLQKSKKSKKKSLESKGNIFEGYLWYDTYKSLWDKIGKRIQDLNHEMFSCVLSNVISFVKTTYDNPVNEIPVATILTGINMPDHAAQFGTLVKELKHQVTPHVTCLKAQDCQNLKHLVENMVDQFVNVENESSEDEDLDTEEEVSKKRTIRKSNCNFALLQAWYEEMYLTERDLESPKKRSKTKNARKVLVVIVSDFESFNDKVLQDFILIVSSYINILPFVLVFGIATSLSALHRSLPYQVSSKINIHVFNSQPSTTYLNNVLEHVLFADDVFFHLGGKVFNLFTDIFLFYDLSVTGFVRNYKLAMLEHFSYGNAMALCGKIKSVGQLLERFSHDDFESVRHLMSFRRLVETETPENRIKLLNDDEYFKNALTQEISKLHEYVRSFYVFLKCLHVLVNDLPKNPLGRHVREVYAFATSQSITQSAGYKESFQLLAFQSREELASKLSKIEEILVLETRKKKNEQRPELQKFLDELNVYVNNLNTVGYEESEQDKETVEEENEEAFPEQMLDRKKLKAKLLQMTKKTKPMNKYERLRQNLLEFLSDVFRKRLREPSSYIFHEIYFYNDVSIQQHIVGGHRAAIHTALNDPHYYLQCNCCETVTDSTILRSMPDICIAYKLHLEGGKMINLYDWLQAFLSIVDPLGGAEDDDEGKRVVPPQLQARFTQAVAELEFLGFIKSSKRKTDHVSRLTWGG